MKRIGSAILCLFMAVCFLVSCSDSGETSDTTANTTDKVITSDVPVTPPKSGLKISEDKVTISTGETYKLTVVNLATGNPTANVTWQSDAPAVATVSAKGEIKGVSDGTAKITASSLDDKYRVTCQVTVNSKATGIKLSQTEVKMSIGESVQLTAEIVPAAASSQPTFIWESTVPSVVTVDETGKITALTKGSASITVRSGELYELCKVEVIVPASEIKLSESAFTLDAGLSKQLTATITPADATDKNIIWTSSDPAIASVGTDGTVSALAKGETTITAATSNGLSASCKVTVNVNAESVVISESAVSVELGREKQLSATVYPEGSASIIWSSSNSAIVSVDEKGKITALKVGEAIVYAQTADGKSASCTVSVVNTAVSITFDPTEITMTKGSSTELVPTINPATYVDTYKWSSSDHLVAQVNQNGVVTAKGVGTATITITSSSGITASVKVKVEKQPEVIKPTGVTVTVPVVDVTEGQFAEIPFKIIPENATDQSVTYQIISGDGKYAVIKDGKVFAIDSTGSYVQVVVVTSNGIKSDAVLVHILPLDIKDRNKAISDYNILMLAENDKHKSNLADIDKKYQPDVELYQKPLSDIGITSKTDYDNKVRDIEAKRAEQQAALAAGNAAAQEELDKLATQRAELDNKWSAAQLLIKQLDEVNARKSIDVSEENKRYNEAVNTLEEQYDYIQHYLTATTAE